MRVNRRITLLLAVVVLATLGTIALPASAENVRCEYETLVGQTVVGTLVVPVGAVCVLDDVVVVGDVIVRRDADLVGVGVTVTGSVDVRADAYLDLEDSQVSGDIDGAMPFATMLVSSSLEGALSTDRSLVAFVADSDVHGGIDIVGGPRGYTEVFLETARVDGAVNIDRPEFADLFDSTVQGPVEVARSRDGSFVCASEIDGRARFVQGSGPLEIGAGAGCETNYFGERLAVNNHDGAPVIEGNIVRENLRCVNNSVPPTGGDNRVRGIEVGQCADLAPALSTMAEARAADPATADDRRAQVLELRDERRGLVAEVTDASATDQADDAAEEVLRTERREQVLELRDAD